MKYRRVVITARLVVDVPEDQHAQYAQHLETERAALEQEYPQGEVKDLELTDGQTAAGVRIHKTEIQIVDNQVVD